MIITNKSRKKTVWDIVVVIAVCTITPHLAYRLTFGVVEPNRWYWIVTAIYLTDILLGFFTEIHSKIDIKKNQEKISGHYLRHWFIPDLLAVIPFEYLFQSFHSGGHRDILFFIIMTLRLNFLIKILKIPYFLHNIQDNLNLNPPVVRLVYFGLFFSNIVHYVALGWILIGASEHTRPEFDQYLRSLYWCITTVATIGYGDYYPSHDSNLQIIFTIIVQIFGVGMYGYIIGNMSALIADIDSAKNGYQKKMEEVNNYLRLKKIPRDLQDRVRAYFHYLWESRKSVSSVSILHELPRSSSIDILLFLNKDIINKVIFFKHADDNFIREIIGLLVSEIYLPGDYIIRQNTNGDCMFFLSSGSVEVTINGNYVTTLYEGSPFGEAALLSNEKRNAAVRALTYCDVYKLSKHDFDNLRTAYPKFDAEMKKITDSRAGK